MTQVIECLPSKHKALVQTPVPSKEKKNEGREGGKEEKRKKEKQENY
jgi:hypothetical protein